MQTVLVVESEPTDLLALALILRSLGYTVLEADSTDEAISACREHPGPIQLVVTEATLDNKDAREFVGRLRSLCPRIRALLISDMPADGVSGDDNEDIYGCVYLNKPFRVDALADGIETLLRGQEKAAAAADSTHRVDPIRKAWRKAISLRVFQGWMPISRLSNGVLGHLSPPMRTALKWSCLTIVLAAVVPLLMLSTRARSVPAPARVNGGHSVSLSLTGAGNRLHLIWNGSTPAIQRGQCGVLWIADGGMQRRITLDAGAMRAGSLYYWPNTNDVSVRLDLADANIGCGVPSTVSSSNSAAQLAEERIHPKVQGDAADLHQIGNRTHIARRHAVRSRKSKRVSYDADSLLSGLRPELMTPRKTPEVPRVANFPEQQTGVQQTVAAAKSTVSQPTPEPFSTVTLEAEKKSPAHGLMGKIPPLLRRLHPAPEVEPPRVVHESTPSVDDHLRSSLKAEVPLDVRVYVNRSGKVEYAELLSDITEGNRDLATLAVFDARHWEFTPARSGTRVVPGQAILHYRFGNSAPAIAHDQK